MCDAVKDVFQMNVSAPAPSQTMESWMDARQRNRAIVVS
jgi:hypothetical protein